MRAMTDVLRDGDFLEKAADFASHESVARNYAPPAYLLDLEGEIAGGAAVSGQFRLDRRPVGLTLRTQMADDHGEQEAETDGGGSTRLHLPQRIGQHRAGGRNRHHAERDEEGTRTKHGWR